MKRLLATVAAAALLAGACGGDTATPAASDEAKTQFTAAVEALAEAPGQTITFSLDSDVGSLQAMAEEDGGSLSEADAQKILGSSLRISAKNSSDPKDAAAQIVVNVAGNDALELRTIGYSLFLRADAPRLAEAFGQDPAVLDTLAADASAGGLGFIKDAIAGEWLAIKGLDELAEGMTGQPAGQPNAEQQALYEKFLDTLKGSTTVGSEGDDSVGTHLVASFNLKQLYSSFVELSSGLGTVVPGGALPPATDVPNEEIHLDVWVNDGKIVQVLFDFLQLDDIIGEDADIPEGVERFGVKLTLEEFSGEVTEPDGAIEVDPTQIFGSLFGMQPPMGGGGAGKGGGAGYSGEFPCEMLEGEPKEVLEQFKEECPELLKN